MLGHHLDALRLAHGLLSAPAHAAGDGAPGGLRKALTALASMLDRMERYTRESQRIYATVERRRAASAHIACDEYTVADIAFYPWLVSHDELGIDIRAYPHVQAWLHAVGARPAVERPALVMRKT